MTLDDFFTSSEMNNGLKSPSRVMELVAVMQNGRNGTVDSGGTIRQWLTVASVMAATDNKDCLGHFIQSDGIQFIDKWLKDVQKLNDDSDKSCVEETIIHLLQALETLHKNYEKLVPSEIWVTVEDLLVHDSSKVQSKARVLFESWKCKRDGVDSVSVEKVGASANDEMDEREHVQKGSECSKSPSRYSSPSSASYAPEKGQKSATDEQYVALHPVSVAGACNSKKILDTATGDDRASDQVVPPLAKPTGSFPQCESIDTTLVESCIRFGTRQDINNDGLAEFPKLESTGDLMHVPKIECCSEKLVSLEESKTSDNKATSLSSDAADANDSVMEHVNKVSCDEAPPFIDSKKIDSGGKYVVDDVSYENKCSSSSPDFSCQAAIKVDRAVDSKEQCSYGKPAEGNIRQPCDLVPVSENQSHDGEGSSRKVMDVPELSAEASPTQELAICMETRGMTQTSSTQEMETSQVTEVAHEEARTVKSPCKIDLNQEVCSEDIDRPGNQTGTISMVSASRDAMALGFPVSPMQYDGNLGWKGSLIEKGSVPASPGQSPKSNEDPTFGVISSTPKPPQGFHEIDLNVTETGDGSTRDLLHDKQVPVYFGLPSGESSVETDSRKSERYDVNLNLTSVENIAPRDWRIGHHLPEENDHHQSHSSSASSKQSLSIVDLNDQPFYLNDSSHESTISIMGARVKVNSKDLVQQTILSPNGRTPELTFDVAVGTTESCFTIGSALPYSHSDYNNATHVPEVVVSPFSSSFYGSGGAIPYMVDSRLSPVIPQIAGIGFSQPPFISNLMSSIPSDGAGPSRSSFDLNSEAEAMVNDGGRDPLVLRDFLDLAPIRSTDDQIGTSMLPSVASVASGKRKEPDNGLEYYPFRNYTPPWE